MRLIDADKLRKQVSEDYAQSISKINNPVVKAIVEKAVETFDGYIVGAETVNAIPVDWLENFLREESNKGLKSDALLVAYGIIILCKWKEETDGKTD